MRSEDGKAESATDLLSDEREQTRSDLDVTVSDQDQALADRDQTSSDSDQQSSDEDQSTADQSLAAGGDADAYERTRSAREHASEDRDATSALREISAELRSRERAQALRIRTEAAEKLELAAKDALTGGRIRSIGLVEVTRELERAHRTEGRLVLAFVDVDGLKEVNDSRGHKAGDELLRFVGLTLRAHLRPYDLIVRYGGDEFVCAMPHLSVPQASLRFEEIAAALRVVEPKHSISFGLAQVGPGDDLEELIARADANLLDTRTSGP